MAFAQGGTSTVISYSDANDAAAVAAGLVAGDLYQITGTGVVSNG